MNALGNPEFGAMRELTTAETDQVSGGQVYSPPSYPYHQGNEPQMPAPVTTKPPSPPYTS